MPGNKAIYTDAIRKGHNAAWDGKWNHAIAEYQRALAEFPEDATVHLSLAHAQEEAGQLENALHECRIASKFQPHDPQPLVRAANLQEKLKLLSEAAGTYLAIADIYVSQKAMTKAVEMWQRSAALEPDRTDVHQRLAEAFERAGRQSQAAKEYIALARIYLKRGDMQKMTIFAQKALALDPHSTAAKTLQQQAQDREPKPSPLSSPVDMAQKIALSKLAETLLGEQPSRSGTAEAEQDKREDIKLSQSEVDALITRAVDAQTRHHAGEAIDCYSQLLAAGVSRPEVKFNLGLLYFETMRYEDAIKLLTETLGDSNYALASHYTLGQCHRAQGKMDSAVEHFLQVTKIVDLGSVRRDQADELISVYEGLAESFAQKGDREQAESFSRALEAFLAAKGWEDKVKEVRHHLESLRGAGDQVSLAEVIEVPGSAEVLEALSLSQEYMRLNKLDAASEECLLAIELAPLYVPAHMRLAEVLAQAGRGDDACEKYQHLAELAEARRDLAHAESLYRRQLEIRPDDVGGRSRLVDVLIQQGQEAEALFQYLELGDIHTKAGRNDRAAETLSDGARLAMRTGSKGPFVSTLRHRLAEAYMRQDNIKAALATYQEIHQASPDDEHAHICVADLEYALGMTSAALADLDSLLEGYRARNESHKAISVLDNVIENHPAEAAPRARLAQLYLTVGNKDKALAVLDALGEMQMSAGQRQAAAATIRQIISMDPPRVEEYKQLLQQIAE